MVNCTRFGTCLSKWFHVVKTGSELLTIFFEIIPRLNQGVLIHFHDIFYPFEYPSNWVLDEGRSWNEAYFIRALLQSNNKIKILLFADQLRDSDLNRFSKLVSSQSSCGSLWLEIA